MVSKCPEEIVINTVSSVYMRACWELFYLGKFTKDLDTESCGMEVIDKGLVNGCFVTEFILKPIDECLQTSKDVLHKWELIATPPDLSGC